MTQLSTVNYPDLLGTITGKKRLVMDGIQYALALRPSQIPAGYNFEILLLIQNAQDVPVDITIELKLPDRDAARQRGMFFSKKQHLLIGLAPAEVGYARLPASCSPRTQPGSSYSLNLSLQVTRPDKSRKPVPVRTDDGGGAFAVGSLPPPIQEQLKQLHSLNWSDRKSGRNQIALDFEVKPRAIAPLVNFEPGWSSLWTMANLDEYTLASQIRKLIETMQTAFTREKMFKPLLAATQQRFQEAAYPLKIAEGIFITKLLVRVLCDTPVEKPTQDKPLPPWPAWYKYMAKSLFKNPELRNDPEKFVTTELYPFLLYDAVIFGFQTLSNATEKNYGSPPQLETYAENLVSHLVNDKANLNFGLVYMPLIVGGVVVNNLVVMPREDLRNTLNSLDSACRSRSTEKNEKNAAIFKLVDELIERGINFMGGSM